LPAPKIVTPSVIAIPAKQSHLFL